MTTRITILLLAVRATAALAQDPLATHIRPTEPLSPPQQLQTFHLPEGFEIQLFASEPDIQKPMNMAFDARGRLWVSGSVEYPFAAKDGEGRDSIRVLEDTDGDGRADKITTFVDGLNIPMGLYPHKNGVVAYSIPNIYFFQDSDGDGVCDKREELYGPLGDPVDTHGMQNAFRRGFDGWLYICHGFRNESVIRGRDGSEIQLQSGNTYRVRLDGSRVEQFTWGQVNPFGSTFTPAGDLITADCHSHPLTLLLRDGYYSSFGKPDDGLGFVPPIMRHSHGSTAISGAAIYAAESFPEPYRGSLFVGNVMTSRVHRDDVVMHGSTLEAREAEDFLTCNDPWFRPVDLQIGPDGALYLADFYNRVIGHYEVPLDHPQRDRERGRIWRVSYRGGNAKQATVPNLSAASAEQLIATLASPSMTRRMLATDQLSDRVGDGAVDLARNAATNSESPLTRVHALWVLSRLGKLQLAEIETSATDPQELVRVHAMRLLSETADWSEAHRALAINGLGDAVPLVRRAAADALGQHPDPSVIEPLLSALLETSAEDMHLQHGLRIAIRNQLRQPGAFVVSAAWDRPRRQTLCEIALAVPSEEAAAFLVRAMSDKALPRERLQPALKHAAAHASADLLEPLVKLVRELAGEDVDFQVEMIQLLGEQLPRRGTPRSASVEAWGSDLAARLLEPSDAAGGWVCTSARNAWGLEHRNCADGRQGVTFLSSLPGGEQATGVLRSPPFELPSSLSFYLCGHLGPPQQAASKDNVVRLRLAATDRVIQRASPPRHDTAQRVEWDLSEFTGQQAYLEVVDGLALPAYAWLAVSRIEPPVSLPSEAPLAVARRQLAGVAIAKSLRLSDLATRLTELATSEAVDDAVRAACVDALQAMEPRPAGDGAVAALGDWALPRGLRTSLLAALAEKQDELVAALLRDVMMAAPSRSQQQLAERLASSNAGAELLLRMIEEGKASPRLLQRVAIDRALRGTSLPRLARRIERLTAGLPPANEERARVLRGRIAEFAAAETSAERGKQVFAKHCAACHRVADQGSLVGPQLDGIGNRGLERVVEDLLDPNHNIDAAFHVSVLVTGDGRVLTGLYRRDDGPAKVFAGKDGKEFSVLVPDIEEEQKSRSSIMPDNFDTVLSKAECFDLLAHLLTLRATAASAIRHETDVFVSGEAGYHTYRIPSLVATPDGALLAICEGRKTNRADHGDVDLVCKRSSNGGRTWGPLQLLYEEGGAAKITIGNPCPVVDQQTGVIWLPFTRDNDDVFVTSSSDGGFSWSEPRKITADVKRDDWTWYATGPGHGIQLQRGPNKGRLVIPCDHRVNAIEDRRKSSRSHVIYSDDHGQTWKIGGVTDFQMNECAVVELADGPVMLNMRSNRGQGCRAVAISADGGLTWSDCEDVPSLVEPVCQASLIRDSWPTGTEPGRILFSNPASSDKRERMTIRISDDEGRSWDRSVLIYEGSSAYSSLAKLPSGGVGILYERDNYATIRFAELTMPAVTAK